MITINVILLLKIIAIGFLISHFEPIQWIIDYLPENIIKWNLQLMFGCMKCVSFWTAIIWTLNIWFSIFTFFIVAAIARDDKFIYYSKKIKESIRKWIKTKRINYYHRQMERIIQKINDEK